MPIKLWWNHIKTSCLVVFRTVIHTHTHKWKQPIYFHGPINVYDGPLYKPRGWLPDGLNSQSHPATEIRFGPSEAAPRGSSPSVQLTLGLPNPSHPENFRSVLAQSLAGRSASTRTPERRPEGESTAAVPRWEQQGRRRRWSHGEAATGACPFGSRGGGGRAVQVARRPRWHRLHQADAAPHVSSPTPPPSIPDSVEPWMVQMFWFISTTAVAFSCCVPSVLIEIFLGIPLDRFLDGSGPRFSAI